MAEHLWTVLCQKAVIDQTSNAVSLVEVVEELAISPLAEDKSVSIPVSFDLVTLTIRSEPEKPESLAGRMALETPKGAKLAGGQFEIDLTKTLRHRSKMHMTTLPLVGAGTYYLIIEYNDEKKGGWRVVSRLPLEINPISKEDLPSVN